MSHHVPDDLLQSFVDGDVDEAVAVHIAEHLDACPSCATRATHLEPLFAAFAAVDDPMPPPELLTRVLEQARTPEPGPAAEIAIGGGLLFAAAIAIATLGEPLHALTQLGLIAEGLTRFASVAEIVVASSVAATLSTTAAALLCLYAAARTALPDWRLS